MFQFILLLFLHFVQRQLCAGFKRRGRCGAAHQHTVKNYRPGALFKREKVFIYRYDEISGGRYALRQLLTLGTVPYEQWACGWYANDLLELGRPVEKASKKSNLSQTRTVHAVLVRDESRTTPSVVCPSYSENKLV